MKQAREDEATFEEDAPQEFEDAATERLLAKQEEGETYSTVKNDILGPEILGPATPACSERSDISQMSEDFQESENELLNNGAVE